MSIVWSSLCLVVLLTPGLFFIWGAGSAEGFSREPVEMNPVVQACVSATVAAVIHGLGFGTLIAFGAPVSIESVLHVVLLSDGPESAAVTRASSILTASLLPGAFYLCAATAAGWAAGYGLGNWLVSNESPVLGRHSWVYWLTRRDTIAWVLTNVRQEERALLYKGILEQFALKKDGTFAYVVLTSVEKGYLRLARRGPRGPGADGLRGFNREPAVGATTTMNRPIRKLAIEGEDIANILFERSHRLVWNRIDLGGRMEQLRLAESKVAAAADAPDPGGAQPALADTTGERHPPSEPA